jgi:hypothetical protein
VNVEVKPLNDAEFEAAARTLWEDHRIGFVPGVGAAAEMRTPWILRAVAAGVSTDPEHKKQNLMAILPPMLGLNLIEYARERFDDPELRRKVREIARAVLQDAADQTRRFDLILESVGLYLVRNKSLEMVLDRGDINALVAEGILRPRTHASGEAILSVRLPELLASELALLLAGELETRITNNGDAKDAAEWLTGASRGLPLGDIVAAQAICDAARNGSIGWNLIDALLSIPPREESIPPGSRLAMLLPDGNTAHITVEEGGLMLALPDGRRHLIPPDEDDQFGSLIADMHNWLMLSHLALRPFVLQSPDGTTGRIVPALLLELGTCKLPLRGPQNDPERNSVLTHSAPGYGIIVCHRNGVVEPITMAIYQFLGINGAGATEWIEEAIARDSLPLLYRIEIALRQFIKSADTAKGAWAHKTLDELLRPALEKYPPLH